MNMRPLVSIIMGAYNCETTLRNCINSIIMQTYENWEFIICDDCSTDNTLEIIKEYQKIDSRISVIQNEKNLRLAASLNKCLEVAKGKYIARMDADDESLPERIEKQVEFLENNKEIDVVGCNRIIFDDDGEKGVRKSIEKPDRNVLIKNTPFAHPTIMMKKEVYDRLGGYVSNKATMRAEDLELWFRFFENNFKGYNMQETLYRYREAKADYSKRSLKAGIQTAKVYLQGYKRLEIPVIKRIYFLKPIIASLIPNFILEKYHLKKLD